MVLVKLLNSLKGADVAFPIPSTTLAAVGNTLLKSSQACWINLWMFLNSFIVATFLFPASIHCLIRLWLFVPDLLPNKNFKTVLTLYFKTDI